MPLLKPSSAFLTPSILPLVKRLSLADLRHVHPITGWPLAITLPPTSVPRAGMLAPRCRVKRCQHSPVPCERVIAIRSLPAIRRVSGEIPPKYVNALAWSPDGTRIASASNDKTVLVWDAATGNPFFTYRGHSRWVYAVAWSPDGIRIASAGTDKSVQVWQAV